MTVFKGRSPSVIFQGFHSLIFVGPSGSYSFLFVLSCEEVCQCDWLFLTEIISLTPPPSLFLFSPHIFCPTTTAEQWIAHKTKAEDITNASPYRNAMTPPNCCLFFMCIYACKHFPIADHILAW